jgi:hypothetical protein
MGKITAHKIRARMADNFVIGRGQLNRMCAACQASFLAGGVGSGAMGANRFVEQPGFSLKAVLKPSQSRRVARAQTTGKREASGRWLVRRRFRPPTGVTLLSAVQRELNRRP